jgi:hypothetical protein
MAELCPYKNPWNRCNHKYCTYDVPPYLPRRPQDKGKPAAAIPKAAAASAGAEVLTYYGYNPGPVCAVDTDKLPAVMHEILGVSKALASVVVDAQKECQAAETLWLNITANVAACGFDVVQYDAASVLQAAGIAQQQQKQQKQHQPPAQQQRQQQQQQQQAAAKTVAVGSRPVLQKAAGSTLVVTLPGATLTVSTNQR